MSSFPFLRASCAIGLTWFCSLAFGQSQQITPQQLQAWLQQYPEADTDRDGRLSEGEARAYHAKLQGANKGQPTPLEPTHLDLRYGDHERQTIDVWTPSSEKSFPLIIYFHGGGFVSGDKSSLRNSRLLQQCRDAGVAVAAVNYRFLSPSVALQDCLHDAARAVQYLRHQAEKLGVDKSRVAALGSSAGAGISLWLAFHPEMAKPDSADPIARESTRLSCAAAFEVQYTYDLTRWEEPFGKEAKQRFGGIYNSPSLYGLASEEDFLRPAGKEIRAECDFYEMISADDPPIFLRSSLPNLDLTNVNQYLHHPRHAELLLKRCQERNVTVAARITALSIEPPAESPPHAEPFLFHYLKADSTIPAGSKIKP
ncbi:MAG TPA: alpha/beta hydrolase [Opitutaceae bacterium]|nr:alpha/beta hydrolase [Opitutaceae bacterium]